MPNVTYDKRHSVSSILTAAVGRYRLVNYSGAHATSSADCQGISEQAGAIGKAISLVTGYSYPVEASETIAAGAYVKPAPDGTGRAANGSSGDSCGRALTAAVAGDPVVVRFIEAASGSVSGAAKVLVEGEVASRGTLVCSWQYGVTGTPSTVDAFPDPGIGVSAPQISGPGASFIAATDVANQSSDFRAIRIKVKASKRQDGSKFAYLQLALGVDNTFTDRALCNFTVRADGKWRRYVLQAKQWGTAGAFTLGTTAFSYVRLTEQAGAGAASVTLTAAPAVGASAGTLTAAFGGTTGDYPVRFSTSETRLARLVNGSTAVAWNAPLTTAGATTTMSYYPVRVAMQAGDTVQVGAVFKNPVAKGFFFPRFDDGTVDQVVRRTTMATDFIGSSGVTVPAGQYSMCELAEAFGLRATLYILTRHVGQQGGFATVAQLLAAQSRGHLIAFQSHANPIDGNNAGLRLLGPYGYDLASFVYGSVSASSATSRLTTTAAHKAIVVNTGGVFGDQGYPVQLYGTSLPGGLDTTTKYWLYPVDATTLSLHLTEADSMTGANPVAISSNGGAGTWGYRYWGSAPDGSAILQDFRTGQALMQQWGLNGWRHYAPNQGGWDAHIEAAVMTLMDEGNMLTVNGTQGNGGAGSASFIPRSAVGYVAGGLGTASTAQFATSMSDVFNLPVSGDTDAMSEATGADFVRTLYSLGGVGSNYHHHQNSSAKMRQQCAVYDAAKLCVDQGLGYTGTAEDAYQMLKVAGVA